MNNIKSLIIIVIITLSIQLNSQENICDCCSYASLQYRSNYEELFNPSTIVSKGINEVMIYTTPKKPSDLNASTKYREIKFKFNRKGQVISKTRYNRQGKPHSVYDLKRNKAGKIYQRTFNYIDSLEQKSSFGQEIIDFKYDSKNRLIKIKERDYKGQILADSLSMYTTLDYDDMDRVIRRKSHRYWSHSNESFSSITTFNFSNDSLSSTYQTTWNGKLSLSGEKRYNSNWKEIVDKSYNDNSKDIAFEKYFEYDDSNRIISYRSVAGAGSGSECPDGGSFIDKYEYKDGLPIKILHSYKDNTCEMTFEYSKK